MLLKNKRDVPVTRIAYTTRVISFMLTISLVIIQTILNYLITSQEYIYNNLNMGMC